jgi:hypothetical protein
MGRRGKKEEEEEEGGGKKNSGFQWRMFLHKTGCCCSSTSTHERVPAATTGI